MSEKAPLKSAGSCPVCRKPAVEKFRPFCSKRCADLDLHRWFSGRYAVPVTEHEDEDGAPKLGTAEEGLDDQKT